MSEEKTREQTKEKSQSKAPKKNWFKGLKAEFKKIIWPDRTTLAKQSAATVAVTVVVAVLIAIIDFIVKYGVDLLVR